jgi:hypothetical protein
MALVRSGGVDAVDPLYDVAPRDFVKARTQLAARLRAAGKEEAATAVRKLPKSSATVWAINRLARRDKKLVARLVGAFESLKRAELQRHATGIAKAGDELRVAADAATDRAASHLAHAGIRVTLVRRRQIDATLRGAAVYEREAFLEGVLTHELVAPGFDLFSDVRLRALPRPPSKAKREAVAVLVTS